MHWAQWRCRFCRVVHECFAFMPKAVRGTVCPEAGCGFEGGVDVIPPPLRVLLGEDYLQGVSMKKGYQRPIVVEAEYASEMKLLELHKLYADKQISLRVLTEKMCDLVRASVFIRERDLQLVANRFEAARNTRAYHHAMVLLFRFGKIDKRISFDIAEPIEEKVDVLPA